MKNKRFSILSIILLFSVFFSSCGEKKQQETVVDGVLNLSNFNKEKIYSIDGNWEFYWKQLLTPEYFTKYSKDTVNFIKINNTWQDYSFEDGEKIGGHGFATFHVQIIAPPDDYILKFRQVISSYKIWINGIIVDEIGKVGRTEEEAVAKTLPREFYINSVSDTIDIVVQVSNFSHRVGGIQENVSFGTKEKIITHVKGNLLYCYILIGAELIFAIYFLFTFFFRRKNLAYLFFSLSIIVTLMFELVNGEMAFMRFFPEISSWELTKKMDFFGSYSRGLFFILFIWILFEKYKIINKYVFYVLFTVALSSSLIVLFTPCKIFSQTLIMYMAFGLFLFSYFTFSLFKGLLKKIPNIIYSFIGMFVFVVAMMNDMLFNLNLINTGYFLNTGLLVFFVTHSIILALNYSLTESNITTISNRFEKLERLRIKLINIPSYFLGKNLEIISREFSLDILEMFIVKDDNAFCECKLVDKKVECKKMEQNYISDIPTNLIEKFIEIKKSEVFKEDNITFLSMPLFDENTLKAILVIGRKENRFTKEEIGVFQDLTSQIDVIFDNYSYYWNLENINKNLENVIEKRSKIVYKQKDELLEKTAELDLKMEELNVSSEMIKDMNNDLFEARKEISKRTKVLVEQQEEIKKQREILQLQKNDIDSSINYAKKIHTTIFNNQRKIKNADFVELSMPKEMVNGDFWGSYNTNDKTFVGLIDGTERNITGTFLSFLILSFFEDIINENYSEKITTINVIEELITRFKNISVENEKNKDIKNSFDICLVSFDYNQNLLEFTSTKQNALIVRRGDLIVLNANDTRSNKDLIISKINLKKNDTIYLYSDGILKQQHHKNNKNITEDEFYEVLRKNNKLHLQKQKEEIRKLFINLKGIEEQTDDFLLLGIKPKS